MLRISDSQKINMNIITLIISYITINRIMEIGLTIRSMGPLQAWSGLWLAIAHFTTSQSTLAKAP